MPSFQKHAVITIAHLVCKHPAHYIAMKTKKVPALKVRCPTCGAKPGEKCELSTGLPVLFQDVVHSIGTREADCDEQSSFRGQIEWTSTRMPDSLCAVERLWSKP